MATIFDVLDQSQRFWFIFMHNLFFITGAIFLWGTFIFLALIARRYEIVFHKQTRWQVMLIAPSGILIYVVLCAVAYSMAQVMMSTTQRWIAYSAFFLSGLFSMGGALQFLQLVLPSLKKGS